MEQKDAENLEVLPKYVWSENLPSESLSFVLISTTHSFAFIFDKFELHFGIASSSHQQPMFSRSTNETLSITL